MFPKMSEPSSVRDIIFQNTSQQFSPLPDTKPQSLPLEEVVELQVNT